MGRFTQFAMARDQDGARGRRRSSSPTRSATRRGRLHRRRPRRAREPRALHARRSSTRGPARSARTSSPRSSPTSPPGRSRWPTACAGRATATRAPAPRARTPSARRSSGSGAAGPTSWSPAAPRRRSRRRHRRLRRDVRALPPQRRAGARQPPLGQGPRRLRLRRGRRHAGARVADPRQEARREDLRRDHRLRRDRATPTTSPSPRRTARARARAMRWRSRTRARARPDRLHQRARHLDAGRRRRGGQGRSATSSASTRSTRSSGSARPRAMMGHLLGGAGAVEAASACWPSRPDASRRPSTSTIRIPSVVLDFVPIAARERRVRHAMTQLVRLRRHERDADRLSPSRAERERLQLMKCPFCRHMESQVIDSRWPQAARHLAPARVRGLRAPLHDLRARRGHAADRRQEGRPARAVRSRQAPARPAHRLQQAAGLDRRARGSTPTRSSASSPRAARRKCRRSAIGERVMEHLETLDEVAYVRFASVYRSFRDIDEFLRELGKLVDATTAEQTLRGSTKRSTRNAEECAMPDPTEADGARARARRSGGDPSPNPHVGARGRRRRADRRRRLPRGGRAAITPRSPRSKAAGEAARGGRSTSRSSPATTRAGRRRASTRSWRQASRAS